VSDHSPLARIGLAVAVLASAAATALAGMVALDTLRGTSKMTWLLGRASGLTSYVLLLALVTTGLVLSHPWSRRMRRPTPAARLGLHITLATFTFAFTVLHVVVLATDPWARVGWRGALLPLASSYRPVPVTLGVLALWAGLITGLTARLAGTVAARVWWPVHKVAVGVLLLVWAHAVLAGTDAPILRWFYLLTGAAVLGLAVTRYSARTPADRVAELQRSIGTVPAQPHAEPVRSPGDWR
jgi:hypothetical protein